MTRTLAFVNACVVAFVLSCAIPSATVRAVGSPGARPAVVSVVTDKVKLSLSLPGSRYPRNALVRATLSLTNRSGGPIGTWDCASSSLNAEVPMPNGIPPQFPRVLPPPGAPWRDCAGAITSPQPVNVLRLAPRQTVIRRTYVMLTALSVRARVDLRFPGYGKPLTVMTPFLRLSAATAAGPAVRLVRKPAIIARVTPVSGGGPLLYSQFAICNDAAHRGHPDDFSAVYSHWRPLLRLQFQPFATPTCTSLTEWVLFVAQPGRPIARAYFCGRHDRCAYAPPTSQQVAISRCKVDVARATQAGRLPQNSDVARYAIGLTAALPAGLSSAQAALARSFHNRCGPLLHPK